MINYIYKKITILTYNQGSKSCVSMELEENNTKCDVL